MLEMRNVTKTFDGFKALDQLTLTVPKGSVYGLVGPNGAGKSTAIRHLTGVYRPDSGTVTMDGEIIDEMKSYFGLRTISFDGMKCLINGRSVFQRLILDQGFYPDGIYTAPTDDALKGDIDHHGAKDVMRVLGNKIDLYLPAVCVLDFRDVTFMDSSGIAIIISCIRRMRELRGEVIVENVPPQPMKVLRASGLEQIVKIEERGLVYES